MPLAKPTAVSPRFITFLTVVLVVAVLRLAEDVMIPLALSLMLAFLLSPVVVRLRRWRLPQPAAILLTVTLAFSVIGVVAWQITNQALALLQELPRYEENLRKKAADLKQPDASSAVTRAIVSLERTWAELQQPAPDTHSSPATPPGAPKPVPVEVKEGDATSLDIGRQVLSSLIKPLSTAGIVIVFVIVILFQRDDLRSRFIRVIGGGQLNVATEAVDDAAQRVSRYLLAQLMVNTFFGVAVGLGLFFIGVPHAALWGLLSTLLRFIPFLGPIIAVIFPLALSVAVDPGWSMLLWTAALYIVAELVTNNIIETLVYGSSTGISVLALLIAAVFWSWLWGMPGLFLSTPLTVCLLVIGQYVPGLKFLSVLLGSEPPLNPAAQFYQRMLAMDQEELFATADSHLAQRSLAEFYDDVFVPALLMAEVDRHNGVLAEVRQKFILESSRELIEELASRPRATEPEKESAATPPSPEPRPLVLGFPARDEADELVALMLAHLLSERGWSAEVEAATTPPEATLERIRRQTALVFISALPPSTLSSASRSCRRIKHANPATKVLIGVWSPSGKLDYLKRRLEPAGADGIALRLSDAAAQLEALVHHEPAPKAPAPEPVPSELLEKTETKLAVTRPEDAAETVIRELARAFGVPVALVSVIESDSDFWSSAGGTSTPFAENSVHAEVLTSDVLLAVEDVTKEERFATQALLTKRGVRAFASVPLRTQSGHLVGNLCVLDTQPRTFSDADKELLQTLAAQLMEALESKPSPGDPAAVG
ncbi:AI-2E family transporter [Opitutus terrae]|nr:AI-2E family transporter [Opitutus terrae]